MAKDKTLDLAYSPLAAACADAFIKLTESFSAQGWQAVFEAVALEVPDATSDDIQTGLALAILRTEPQAVVEAEAPDTGEPPPKIH